MKYILGALLVSLLSPVALSTMTAAPGPPPDSGKPVPQCSSSTPIFIIVAGNDSVKAMGMQLNGTGARTVYRQKGYRRIAFDPARTHAFNASGYVDLATGVVRKVTNADKYLSAGFIGPHTIVSDVARDAAGSQWLSTVEVRDVLTDSLIASFGGYSPEVEPGGGVFFLRTVAPPAAADPSNGGGPPYIDIMHWSGSGVTQLKRVELSPEGGPYDVTSVVPLPGGSYAYRQYDEHEYRYFDASDSAYYPGGGHFRNGHESKEQYDLTISDDGRWAAYAERNWNELTYLVVIDLTRGRRKETKVYGSFPHIYGDYVVFVSDPSFVNGGNKDFRQIANFALYAYHAPTGALCEVAQYGKTQASPQ